MIYPPKISARQCASTEWHEVLEVLLEVLLVAPSLCIHPLGFLALGFLAYTALRAPLLVLLDQGLCQEIIRPRSAVGSAPLTAGWQLEIRR
jgi:hypothetical protein